MHARNHARRTGRPSRRYRANSTPSSSVCAVADANPSSARNPWNGPRPGWAIPPHRSIALPIADLGKNRSSCSGPQPKTPIHFSRGNPHRRPVAVTPPSVYPTSARLTPASSRTCHPDSVACPTCTERSADSTPFSLLSTQTFRRASEFPRGRTRHPARDSAPIIWAMSLALTGAPPKSIHVPIAREDCLLPAAGGD